MSQSSKEDQKRDEVLRRMLSTPHKPHAKAKSKKPERKKVVKDSKRE